MVDAAASISAQRAARSQQRAARWLSEVLVIVGVLAIVAVVGLLLMGDLSAGALAGELAWALSGALALGAAAVVRWRRPDHRLGAWFITMAVAGPVSNMLDVSLRVLAEADSAAGEFLAVTFVSTVIGLVGAIAALQVVSRLPDGQVSGRGHRLVLRVAWAALPAFVVVTVAVPVVLVPWYADLPAVPNPLHVPALAMSVDSAHTVLGMLQGLPVLAAIVILVLRYRRMDVVARQDVRWLLVPLVVVVTAMTINVVLRDAAQDLLNVLLLLFQPMFAAAVAMALLAPTRLDADRVLRRSLVHGLLWLAIAGTYVAAGAAVGVTAGRRLAVEWAVTLTVLATLAFQPARRALERIADRWVFGRRSDPAHLVARLGATLADTYDLQALLPRMASTLEDGLGLQWARVRLDARGNEPADDRPADSPALRVPIEVGDDRVGTVECGARRDGRPFTQEDRAVVETLARQAALAVRNVRLTRELQAQADELSASRARLVRAQEAERRRIERNIHDGVQQELVALISQAGRVEHAGGREASGGDLGELQAGLRRVLADLRELAAGIHPSVLSDRGLLAAVEALTVRHPVPVALRADEAIRNLRMPAEVEGAGYFTIAEALANSLKHARASTVEVTLARSNGSLHVTVGDDGAGFDQAAPTRGQGLANLAERVAALGGRLEVVTAPGLGTTVTATLAVDRAGAP